MNAVADSYYNNLTLSDDGKFRNNGHILQWGIDEVKIIFDNIGFPISDLVKMTNLSESTVRRIIRAIDNGYLDSYLSEDFMSSIDRELGQFCEGSINIYDGIHITVYNNGSDDVSGEESIEEHKQINKMRLKAWSKNIKKRGKYICAKCGRVDTEHSQSHHIFPKSRYPSLAYDEGNGIVLCQRCHADYHKKYEGRENAYNFIGWLNE